MSKAAALTKKVKGITSDILSAPARYKEHKSKVKSDYEWGVIHKHRAIKKRGADMSKPARDPKSDARNIVEYNRIKSEHGFK